MAPVGASGAEGPGEVSAVLADPALIPALTQIRDSPQADFVDDACVRRYLRACEGSTKQAAAALATTINWRLSEQPASNECSACIAEPLSHNMRVVGLDRAGRPVIYTCFSQALHRFDPAKSIEHMTRTLEDACAIMAARAKRIQFASTNAIAPVETCVWLVDFYGYSFLKDSDPRTAILAARLLAHYPERLHSAVLVDAPSVFSATWSAFRRIINEKTASKVKFVRSSGGALEADMASWASMPLQEWLLEELSENRRKECQQGNKAYWLPRSSGHDPRAEDDFLRSPEFELTFTSRLADATTQKTQSSLSTTASGMAANASSNSGSILSCTVTVLASLSSAHLASFRDWADSSWSIALLMLTGLLIYLNAASFSNSKVCTASKLELEPETGIPEKRQQPPVRELGQQAARSRSKWFCMPCGNLG